MEYPEWPVFKNRPSFELYPPVQEHAKGQAHLQNH